VARTTYTLAEYQAAAAALAPKGGDVPHVCVRCGTVQSARSFARAGIKSEVYESVIGYSCIGRFVDGVGCDWTCGGLLGDLGGGGGRFGDGLDGVGGAHVSCTFVGGRI
jgi:hypothetical protein